MRLFLLLCAVTRTEFNPTRAAVVIVILLISINLKAKQDEWQGLMVRYSKDSQRFAVDPHCASFRIHQRSLQKEPDLIRRVYLFIDIYEKMAAADTHIENEEF